MARRSSMSPAVVGYWETSGTAARSATAMNGGVGSRGSPMEKSMSGLPASRKALARSWTAAIG